MVYQKEVQKAFRWKFQTGLFVLLVTGILVLGSTTDYKYFAWGFPAPQTITLDVASKVEQGDILQLKVTSDAPLPDKSFAVLDKKRSPLFKQADGTYQALFGVFVDMKPGRYTLQVVSDKSVLAESPVVVIAKNYGKQNISVGKSTAGLKPLPGELEAIQRLKDTMSDNRYWNAGFISPTPDCRVSPFGVRRYHNAVYTDDYHKGVDLKSPQGRPVRAIQGGTIKIAEPRFRLHGGTVGIDHGQGLASVYIHLSKVSVKPGQVVKKGDVVGAVGSTGFATGPHLHWGLYANGIPVNPDKWIPVKHCS